MNRTILITAILVILAIGMYALLRTDTATTDVVPVARSATYSNSELGIAFDHPIGLDGYVVQEIQSNDTGIGLLRTIVLIREGDVERIPEGGEGPPTITIQVFENRERQQPRMWADAHEQYSTINLAMGEIKEIVVGGANAIRYMADGLYVSDNIVVAHGNKTYVISGMFLDEDSSIRRDFEPFVTSVRFIPTPGQE